MVKIFSSSGLVSIEKLLNKWLEGDEELLPEIKHIWIDKTGSQYVFVVEYSSHFSPSGTVVKELIKRGQVR